MNLQEIGWGRVDWIAVAGDKDRWQVVLSAAMNLSVP
jgi:hypothetical protein